MAQENNTAREQTALETLSQDALNQARRERKMIQDTCIAELAQCDTEIPEALEKQVQAEIASLQQAKENLSSAHKIASSTVDELSARAADVAKSLNRKWYRINPPSNTAIDVQEEEKSFFARGMNGYKIALIVFIGSFAGVMLELLWCFARHGYLESRSGLVWGPFNMLYGVGAASLSIILYRFRNRGKWLSFLGGFVVGSVVDEGPALGLQPAGQFLGIDLVAGAAQGHEGDRALGTAHGGHVVTLVASGASATHGTVLP